MALPPENEQSRTTKADPREGASQEVLMREVDEAVRQDELLGAARKYGVPAGIALALALAAFGGWLYWNDHKDGAKEEQSELLVTALDKLDAGQVARANEELATVAKGDGGAAIAAQMTRAGIALQDGKPKDAVALYDAVAANEAAPKPYRDLAAIRSISANFENLQPQQVVDRLKPLAVPGNPWFGSAGELVAMAYIKQGKTELAGPLLATIAKDEKVPESLRSRTRQLAGLLGQDAITDVDATLQEMRTQNGAAPAAQ